MKRVAVLFLLLGGVAVLSVLMLVRPASKSEKVAVSSLPPAVVQNATNVVTPLATLTNTPQSSVPKVATASQNHPEAAAFSNWAERYLAGDNSASVAQGSGLLWRCK